MRSRLAAFAIVLLMVVSGFVFVIPSGVRATSADNTWISDSASYSGIPASWENGSLVAGQNIWFVDAHDGSCIWNNSLGVTTFGAFYIRTGYTGTVTQAASFSVTKYSQAAGTLTGAIGYTLSDSGAFAHTGGTITGGKINLIMTTGTTTITSAGLILYSLRISSSTNWMDSGTAIAYGLTIDSGKTLTFTGTLDQPVGYAGAQYFLSNSGSIVGSGLFRAQYYDASNVLTFGSISCPVKIYLHAAAVASRTCTLGTNTIFASTLDIVSNHASNTMTLDLSASNYALTAAGITIDARGILNGRGSQITDSGIWNSQNGTFTKGTSTLHLTGTSKNLWMETNGMFQNLIIPSGASYTLRTNAKTYNYWKNGTLTNGAYTFYVNNDQAPLFTSTIPATTFSFASDYSFDFNATDREAETLTYGLTTNFSGLGINSTSGLVSRAGAPHARGTFLMHISVTDGNHTAWQNYTLTVTNLAPVIVSSMVHVTITEGSRYSYQFIATDPENYSLIYTLTTDASFLSPMNFYGYFNGTPAIGQAGFYYVSIRATDGFNVVYQNYSLDVQTLSSQTFSPGLLLALAFGFGLIAISVVDRRRPIWATYAGFIWITLSVVVLFGFGLEWFVIGLGIGFILMFEGTKAYAAGRQGT